MNIIANTFRRGRSAAWQAAPVALVASGLAILVGCSSEPESHVVSAPPPGAVVSTSAAPVQVVATPVQAVTTANGTVILTQAPPVATQPQVIVARPPRPSSSDVWLDGYWTWRDSRYEWVNAHWETPPSSSDAWVPPHWEQRSDGNFIFYEGHWN